jgi:hypothetical protein
VSNYQSQKNAEIEWIRQFSQSNNITISTYSFEKKFQIMKELKSEVIKQLKNSITLIHPLQNSYFGKKISYRYQRQDFRIEDTSQLEVYYPGLKSEQNVQGYFTQSGQAATLGLFHHLKKTYPKLSIRLISPKIYFETLRVFEGLSIPQDKKSKIGFIDSCTSTTHPMEYLEGKNLKQLIVDTTTWGLNSEEIQSIINWARDHQVVLYLIRSYIKLDCLGGEYGLLGSIVKLNSHISPEENKTFLETLSYCGSLAIHENIYPFLWDKKFLDLTSNRVERIRSNTRYLVNELDPYLKSINPLIRVTCYQHELYFGVYYPKKDDLMPEIFLKLSILHQIPSRFCDSFGFDFPSLTNVLSNYEKSQESALRFCPGDNEDIKENLLKLLKDYFAVFFREI